jgi:hypothetical protein
MAASCVACSTFAARPTDTHEGPMCARCVRFMRRMAEQDALLALAPDAGDVPDLDALLADSALAELAA